MDGTFHYNKNTDVVTLKPIAGNTNLQGIEGLFRNVVVEFESTTSNITFRNINIWYGASDAKQGILLVDGTDHLIEDIDVKYSAGGGVDVDAGALRVTMDNITVSHHGQIGVACWS